HLHFDPLSLAGEHPHDVVDRLVLSAVHPALSYAVLSSALSIDHTSDSLAVLRLPSTYREANPASELPRPVLDVPNMRIETSPKVGLLVRLVPEPSGVTIAASFLVVGLVRRTRRIC